MWEEILKTALESGLWAVLFCVLLLYQLRDGRSREEKYRNTIDALVGRLGTLEQEIAANVSETLRIVKKRERKKTAADETDSGVAPSVGGQVQVV